MLSNIALGDLFLSLGILALVAARLKSVSGLSSKARKIEAGVELLAGIVITVFSIIIIVVTYSTFAQKLNFLAAGGITAESMLSTIIGITICLLTYNRIKKTP